MDQDLFLCYIDPDKMWVSISIHKPEGEEAMEFSVDHLKTYLQEKGIKVGINDAALEALTSSVEYDQEIVVVTGKQAINGEDGHYEYLIPMEDKKAKPVVSPDGSVDYKNSLAIAMIEKDQIFAEYIPPTKGEYGYNIYYEMIPPVPGKPAPPLKGTGFVKEDGGNTYIASKSGRIYMDGDKVVIDPLYVVSGDLDVHHGNIRFNGDVEVRGDMHSGTRIEAEGSVFINGHVGSCVIHAGENITIGKGVQGKYDCEILAGGDIAGSFMEHCNIKAGGSVYANSLLDCFVIAREKVQVTSKNGCIIGGEVQAMQLIEAKGLGNESEIVTTLTIGELPVYREEMRQLVERKIKIETDLQAFQEKLKTFEEMHAQNPTTQTEDLKRQVARAKILLTAENMEVTAKLEAYDKDLARARESAHVYASGTVYRGVTVKSIVGSYMQEEACKDIIFWPRLTTVEAMSPEEYANIKKTEQAP